eukprot:XP_001698598.1 predicted protein [Chlamydomonas reinhardtii]
MGSKASRQAIRRALELLWALKATILLVYLSISPQVTTFSLAMGRDEQKQYLHCYTCGNKQHVLRRQGFRRNASSVSGIDLDTFDPPPPDEQLETLAAPSPPAPEQLTAAPATEDAVAAVVTAVPEPEAAQLRPVLRAVSG